MRDPFHIDDTSVKNQRRQKAIEHMNARIEHLSVHGDDRKTTLAGIDSVTKKIEFLTSVRDATVRNLGEANNIPVADHITDDMLTHH